MSASETNTTTVCNRLTRIANEYLKKWHFQYCDRVDIIQDIQLRLVRKLRAVEAGELNLDFTDDGLLIRMLQHAVVDFLRRRNRRGTVFNIFFEDFQDSEVVDIGELLDMGTIEDDIRRLVDLAGGDNPELRTIVLLRLRRRSPFEIADFLGVSVATVQRRIAEQIVPNLTRPIWTDQLVKPEDCVEGWAHSGFTTLWIPIIKELFFSSGDEYSAGGDVDAHCVPGAWGPEAKAIDVEVQGGDVDGLPGEVDREGDAEAG